LKSRILSVGGGCFGEYVFLLSLFLAVFLEQDLNRLLAASIYVVRRQCASSGVSLRQIHALADVGYA
jgi:hypothetical protein